LAAPRLPARQGARGRRGGRAEPPRRDTRRGRRHARARRLGPRRLAGRRCARLRAEPPPAECRLREAPGARAGRGARLGDTGARAGRRGLGVRLALVLRAAATAWLVAAGALRLAVRREPAARSLARTLERLGPTYVKLGQLLATRRDLLSAET